MSFPAPALPPTPARVLRTPDDCFEGLADFAYPPHYSQVGGLRVAHIDEGPHDGPLVLLMHGEPTWSYLYRKMIPPLLTAGCRVVVPDLVGFGRSDKPARARDHSYAHQVAWMSAWMAQLDLRHVTLFCQDWGSLIGLRMVAHMPERFARVALANGGLPTGDMPVPAAFHWWRRFARYSPWFPIGRIVSFGCVTPLSAAETNAYDAPFPSRAHQAAARAYPGFVPISPADPERAANTQAWDMLRQWHKPFITLFSTRDPVTRGGERMFQEAVPGAQGQAHTRVRTAGHFLQEDKGPELAQLLWQFMASNPIGAEGQPQPRLAP